MHPCMCVWWGIQVPGCMGACHLLSWMHAHRMHGRNTPCTDCGSCHHGSFQVKHADLHGPASCTPQTWHHGCHAGAMSACVHPWGVQCRCPCVVFARQPPKQQQLRSIPPAPRWCTVAPLQAQQADMPEAHICRFSPCGNYLVSQRPSLVLAPADTVQGRRVAGARRAAFPANERGCSASDEGGCASNRHRTWARPPCGAGSAAEPRAGRRG
jgi:hypothetical protein